MTSKHSTPTNAKDATEASVIVYTSPTCGYCHMVKEYLQEKGVPFTERDISTDQEALMFILEKVGQAVTPITTIGEKVVIGFDRPKIDEALASLRIAKP